MTKAEIVQVLYDRVGGFSRREATALVDEVFEVMKETLGGGEHVKTSGFGKFALRDKAERPGRNPQTGERITIEGRRGGRDEGTRIRCSDPRRRPRHERQARHLLASRRPGDASGAGKRPRESRRSMPER